MPIVAAVSTNDSGNPMRIKLLALVVFTREVITNWARANLTPGCDVHSDGLSCFVAVTDAGCAHSFVVGNPQPRDMPQFTWINTILGNLKTAISGGRNAFKFAKCASNYLGAFAYRFNGRLSLPTLLHALIGHAVISIIAGVRSEQPLKIYRCLSCQSFSIP